MRVPAALALCAAAILLLSAAAHAFLGWPPLRSGLVESGVDPALIGGLMVGWVFGSVAMTAFGALAFWGGRELLRGNAGAASPLRIIGAAYVVFGAAAFAFRDFNPFFLLFVATGTLLVAAGWPAAAKSSQ